MSSINSLAYEKIAKTTVCTFGKYSFVFLVFVAKVTGWCYCIISSTYSVNMTVMVIFVVNYWITTNY